MKKRCRYDLPLFARYYFPAACRLPWSRLHRYLFSRRKIKTAADAPERRGCIDVVLAPRGAAKSTLVSFLFPIHSMLYGIDPYVIIISATHRQALGRLSNIRQSLRSNERLAQGFARELEGWGQDTQSSIIVNAVKIDAFSAGSEIRGLTFGAWRPAWIVLDDVESSNRVLTSIYRDALSQWMSEVIENLGNGYTNIDLIGTLLHTDALPMRLSERPDVRFKTFRSIIAEAGDHALWKQWQTVLFDLANPDRIDDARRFYEEREEAMQRGARVLWPEKEDYYDLQVMRATRGRAAFDKEKQNAPLADDATFFPVGELKRFSLRGRRLVLEEPCRRGPGSDPGVGDAAPPPEIGLDALRIFGFLDPAMGESKREGRSISGDFAAIATVGIDRHGYLYVLDVWLERAPPSVQIPKIFDSFERWGYSEFGVETNAFQKFLLDPLERERERRRAQGKSWALPVRGVRHRASKRMRVLQMEPLARNGWILFNTDLSKEFMNQLSDFPNGRHDDGPDALAAAIKLARSSSLGAAWTPVKKRRGSGRVRSY